MLADATSIVTSGTARSFIVSSSTWSIIVTLLSPNCPTLSSSVLLSFELYSTAITSPSPSNIAASTAIDSPDMTQIFFPSFICIFDKIIDLISEPT